MGWGSGSSRVCGHTGCDRECRWAQVGMVAVGLGCGVAGGAVSPPKVSVCPQRAPKGPTMGPAASTGKLRQGALYPWRWLCIPGCVPVVVCDPWQQAGFCGMHGMQTGVVQCPWGCVQWCMGTRGCWDRRAVCAALRGHTCAASGVCGCARGVLGSAVVFRGVWGVQGGPGWSYTCRVVQWYGCPQAGCVAWLWVTPRALSRYSSDK